MAYQQSREEHYLDDASSDLIRARDKLEKALEITKNKTLIRRILREIKRINGVITIAYRKAKRGHSIQWKEVSVIKGRPWMP